MCEDEGTRGGVGTAEAVVMVRREQVGCASGSGGGRVNKVGETMRDMLGRAHISLRGG